MGSSWKNWNTTPTVRPRHVRHLVLAHRLDGLVAHPDLAGRRPVDPGDHVDQGRFPRARLAEDRHELARSDVQLDALERVEIAGRSPVRLTEVLQPDQRLRQRTLSQTCHSYANTSRTVRRTALRAGARLATAAIASKMKNQTIAPTNE